MGNPAMLIILDSIILTVSHFVYAKSYPPDIFRRPRNLRDTLIHSKTIVRATTLGFQLCNAARCKTCRHTMTTSYVKSPTNNAANNIPYSLSFISHSIIYLITCIKCNKQYVGQTSQTLRARFTHHRFTITNDRDTYVARHFNLGDHTIDHVNITATDRLSTSDTINRLNKDTHWIYTLKAFELQGLNVKEQTTIPITTIRTSQG
ncbi:hypothetical protein PoB_001549700 [Plakobranchus ocellatus]|uniref:GIY-YIG domain-containing protein n=1 Tax=Plakobranchus ocellatus TaxID=259542 RepID=A0AAV3Z366_9GAST|nr:hypothetical protein PoB_001549700 [Plakobranchus ocellatus]